MHWSLLPRAHDIRIILDVVPNHCSTEHPWFAAAVAAAPGSSPSVSVTRVHADPPKIAFQLFGDRGVDGFRADAVIYLGKVDGLPDADPSDVDSPLNPLYTYVPWQHEIWRQWRDLVNRYEAAHGRELLLVAEAFSPNDPELMVAYANPDEFHQVFAFDLMLASWHADRIRAVIKSTLDAALPHGLLPAWTLNNHDTQRSPTRYGRSDAVQIGGFHDGAFRISDAPLDAALGLRRAKAASALALPGCVYLHAGEEPGLLEVLDLPDEAREDPVFHCSGGQSLGRDGCRVPLPWTRRPQGSYGFSGTTDPCHIQPNRDGSASRPERC